MQTRMRLAIADLQFGQCNEEAAEEPGMRTEAPAAAHPEARDEGPRYKTTICRHWQQATAKKATHAPLHMVRRSGEHLQFAKTGKQAFAKRATNVLLPMQRR